MSHDGNLWFDLNDRRPILDVSDRDEGRTYCCMTKVHVKHILSKLGVGDRAEVVFFAFATGLVKLGLIKSRLTARQKIW